MSLLPTTDEFRGCYNRGMELRLKELRKQRGMTQREVADLAGMSVSYYTEIENGKKQINAHRMDRIARALGASPPDLILDTKNPEDLALLESIKSLSDQQRQLIEGMVAQLKANDSQG
ncbi:MAG: helix-turn-helix domain-containing protein [Pseudomonadota bacterium]